MDKHMNPQKGLDRQWQDQYGNYHSQGPAHGYQDGSRAQQPVVIVPQQRLQDLSGYQYHEQTFSAQSPFTPQSYQHPPQIHPPPVNACPPYHVPWQPQLNGSLSYDQTLYTNNHHHQMPHLPAQGSRQQPESMPPTQRRRSSGSRTPLASLPAQSQHAHVGRSDSSTASQRVPSPEGFVKKSSSHSLTTPMVATSSRIENKSEVIRSSLPQSTPSVAASSRAVSIPDSTDYQLLLLALAEQYITAARSLSSVIAQTGDSATLSQYGRLMTHGLACVDSVLKNWRISDPRLESQLRLQYASLLFQETDNDDLAINVLSKGITICDRSRLTNQKYSMHHLMVRIQYKSNSRAALNSIDALISDLVAYDNVLWIYAFRLLRLSLTITEMRPSELPSMLQQVKSLVMMSESRRDIPMYVMSNILGAFIHLRTGGVDQCDLAERAIAAARSHQLDPRLEELPQLQSLVLFLDLCCDIIRHKRDQIEKKIKALQVFVDGFVADENKWTSGDFHVPLSANVEEDIAEETCGIFQRNKDGKCGINFRGLNKNDLFMLSFLLSGLAALETGDNRAERFLSEGIAIGNSMTFLDPDVVPYLANNIVESKDGIGQGLRSLEKTTRSMEREESLNITMQIYRILTFCNRSNWETARRLLDQLEAKHDDKVKSKQGQLLTYLSAVVHQGQGDVRGAAHLYGTERLMLPTKRAKGTSPDLDLRILATMNRIAILQSTSSTKAEAQALFEQLMAFEKHPDLAVQAAINLLRPATIQDLGIIPIKNSLSAALGLAQKVANHQLIALGMNSMFAHLFVGIVGEQAEKSVSVAYKLSGKAKSPLLLAISCSNMAKSLELHGKHGEAATKRAEAEQHWSTVPPGVRQQFDEG